MLRTRTVFQSVKRKLHDLSAPDSSRHTSSDSHTPLYMPIREPSPSSRPQLTNLQQDAIWEALTVGLALKHNFEAVYESLLEVAHLPQYSLKPGACSLSTGIQGNVEQRAVNNTIARIKDISDGLRKNTLSVSRSQADGARKPRTTLPARQFHISKSMGLLLT